MRRNNDVYSKLVQDQNDFIGKITYSIYKEDKINYFSDFIQENHEEPNEQELEQFMMVSSLPPAIDRYRLQAENLLQTFLEHTLSDAIEENVEKVRDNYALIVRNEVEKLKPTGFWASVWQNIAASLVITSFFALLLLIINFSMEGFWETLGKLFNYNITPKK